MKRDDKKAALAAYKERKPEPGIYVVRCAATDQVWGGAAPELSAIWNRVSFALRQGEQKPASAGCLARIWAGRLHLRTG